MKRLTTPIRRRAVQRIEQRWGGWVLRRRWPILCISLWVAALSLPGIFRLRFNDTVDVLFGPENPEYQALMAFDAAFGEIRSIVFTLAPADGDLFSKRTLGMMHQLAQRAKLLPYVHDVISLPHYPRIRLVEEEIVAERLISEPDSLTTEELAELRCFALSEPRLVHRLISAAGDAASIMVLVDWPQDDTAAPTAVTQQARSLRDEFRQAYPDIDLYLTGSVLMDQSFKEAAQRDLHTLAPAMALLIFLLLGVILKSFWGMLAVMAVMAFTVVISLGVAGWLGIPLSIISASAPGLIVTLAIADSVHIVTTIFQRLRAGAHRTAAVQHAMRTNLQPVFLTSLTTVIGFLSLNFSESPPFRDLGNIVVIGIITAFLLAAFLLPALISLLPIRARSAQLGPCPRVWQKLACFVIRRASLLRVSLIVLTLCAVPGIFGLELDTHYRQLYSQRLEIRRATDFHIERMKALTVISYPLDAGSPGGIAEPEFLAQVADFTHWYRQQPGVLYAQSVADSVIHMHQLMSGEDSTTTCLPRQRETIAQYLLLLEMALPTGSSLATDIDITHQTAAVHVLIEFLSARELRALDAAAQAWLRTHTPTHMHSPGASNLLIWAHLTPRNIRGMAIGTAGALALISLCMVFALRSLRLGWISLLPNVLPPLLAFGLWGLWVGEVGLPTTVIAAMTIGIVVDDTIHLLSKYIRARRTGGLAPARAIEYIFEKVGPALCTTTAVLAAGFSVLATSPFGMTAVIGRLCALIIIWALVFDLLLLPPLLLALEATETQAKQPAGHLK